MKKTDTNNCILIRKPKRITGTKEWSIASVNCVNGCSHDCRYCYARYNAVDRFHRMKRADWGSMRVRDNDVRKSQSKCDGTIMFPTTHDITPEVLEPCLTVLGKLLDAGNEVLVVSKPHRECIREICQRFQSCRGQIKFRFSIGAADDTILAYWEPGAPSFAERCACLGIAKDHGFRTSVSAEPMLDSANIVDLVSTLDPLTIDTIWIGKLNCLRSRVKIESDEDARAVELICAGQTDERIREIYLQLQGHPKVRWKESIKKVVGIDLADEAGLDL